MLRHGSVLDALPLRRLLNGHLFCNLLPLGRVLLLRARSCAVILLWIAWESSSDAIGQRGLGLACDKDSTVFMNVITSVS